MNKAPAIRWGEVKPHVPAHWLPVGPLQQSRTGAFAVFSIRPTSTLLRGKGRLYCVVKFYYDENNDAQIAYIQPNTPTRLTNSTARELAKAKAIADAMPYDDNWDEVE